ncbi:MAG: cupin domain-containing protein [Psychroserpens sp.]|uniref:cupin domain-containing protein n=1 Tax=Psychroserpens sp. TaxID=2020870 RepID=UPI003C96EFD3
MIKDAESNEYRNNLDKLRNLRNEAYKGALLCSSGLKLVLKKFHGVVEDAVNWKDLEAFPKDVWIDIFPGIKAVLIWHSDNRIVFLTTMEPGSEFSWHRHEDCEETVLVLDGDLYELETDEIFKEGESLIYEPGEPHTPTTINGNKLKVTFTRNL